VEPLIQYYYYPDIHLTLVDLFMAVAILLCGGMWGFIVHHKHRDNPHYRFYSWALMAKLFAGFVFCLLYMTFYEGDTLDYFHGMNSLNNVATDNFGHYLDLLFKGNKPEFYSYFNTETMHPDAHMWRDPKSFFVIRFLSPFAALGFGSYVITTMLISWVSFTFLWKMYLTFARLYPTLDFKMAIAILFMPSVIFWGSSVLKDTIMMAAVAAFTVSFLNMAVKGKVTLGSMLSLLISSWLMISIKAYILIAMIPGAAIWFAHGRILAIKSQFMRYATYPFMMAISLAVGVVVLSSLGSSFGEYGSMDKMVAKAQLTQEDLKRENSYGKNYYDLGKIENTPSGLVKLMPQAIIAGLYRPFIWEARNPFIALSGLENLFTLFLTLSILYRTKVYKMFSYIGRDPILIFTLLYTIMFAFGIGLATANFGALVRYRIPGLPFLMLSLFVLDYYLKEGKRKEQEAEAERVKDLKTLSIK
jgi:hypothetical protein